VSFVRQSKQRGEPEPGMAELVARLPGVAFSLAKQLLAQCEALKQRFIDEGIDTSKTIEELEKEHWWWFGGKYKTVRGFHSLCNALSNIAGSHIDDFIAVARCRDQIELVVGGFAEAKELKNHIDQIVRRDVPVGKIIDDLIVLARHLRDEVQIFT
jgi:hypothetical protein